MALISKSRPGREDGGYTRLLGNPALGALISRIHASAIAAGNELEKIIPQHALLFQSADITRFVSGALPPGNYLVCKRDIRQHFKPMIGSSMEPDFLLICILGTRIYVIELKDGDQFDTKKSFAEVQHLAAFRKDLVNWLRRTEALSQFGVEFKVCFFNARTREEVVAGMKGHLPLANAWTGAEFCRALGISYETIVAQRRQEAEVNLRFVVEQLMSIEAVRAHAAALLLPTDAS